MGVSKFTKPRQLRIGEDLDGFSCGELVVDQWAAKYAAHAKERGSAVVYVTYCEGKPAGFYTLSSHTIERGAISGGWLKRNSPEKVPAILLGMLGVDKAHQGTGLGAQLLKHALENALSVAGIIGAKALIVEPSNDSARRFYQHFGFADVPGTPSMLVKLSL